MFVLTAKLSRKKLLIAVAALAAIAVIMIVIFSGGSKKRAAKQTVSSNEDLVRFLATFGWSIDIAPVQSQKVYIPEKDSELFDRYNALQQAQGYDLEPYRGKNATKYVFEILNYPDSEGPVYASVLVSDNAVIGGDITDSGENGLVHGFQYP
ncbi:MAG: DUF4830 domain-containing protein [Clostridia bacterium]|nr:DUF4830 domain-containing protein [Clostridia bacterium]